MNRHHQKENNTFIIILLAIIVALFFKLSGLKIQITQPDTSVSNPVTTINTAPAANTTNMVSIPLPTSPATTVNTAPAAFNTPVPQNQTQPNVQPQTAVSNPVTTNDTAPTPTETAVSNSGTLQIQTAGRTYNITPQTLVDCINAQAAGQRTGPKCPPNAQQYAGMLGTGR